MKVQYSNIQRTFGAKLTIFPQPFTRSSALTGPLIHVPNISFLLLSRTQALSSNFTTRPSGCTASFLVRTMTALQTSPLRTLTTDEDCSAVGDMSHAFLTTHTISLPTHHNRDLYFNEQSTGIVKNL